jgi:hypothetical protein
LVSGVEGDRCVQIDSSGDSVGLALLDMVLLDEAQRRLTRAVSRQVHAARGCRVERSERGLSLYEVVRLGVLKLRVETPAGLFQQLEDASCRACSYVGNLLGGWLIELVELELSGVVAHEHAIQKECVKVDIQSERRVKPLNERHATGVRLLHASKAQHPLRSMPEAALHLLRERGEHLGAQSPIVTE